MLRSFSFLVLATSLACSAENKMEQSRTAAAPQSPVPYGEKKADEPLLSPGHDTEKKAKEMPDLSDKNKGALAKDAPKEPEKTDQPAQNDKPAQNETPAQNDKPTQNETPAQNDKPGQNTELPPSLKIISIQTTGTGCPSDTVATNIAADAKAFTLSMSTFLAEIGPKVPAANNKSACHIILEVEISQLWSLRILNVDYRGFLGMEAGIEAQLQGRIAMNQSSSALAFSHSFVGARDDVFSLRHTFAETGAWTGCGHSGKHTIAIDTELLLKDQAALGAQGLFTVDSVDGEFSEHLQLEWQRCAL